MLYTWMNANHAAVAGPYREVHLFDRENDQIDFSNIVLELQLPIIMLHD